MRQWRWTGIGLLRQWQNFRSGKACLSTNPARRSLPSFGCLQANWIQWIPSEYIPVIFRGWEWRMSPVGECRPDFLFCNGMRPQLFKCERQGEVFAGGECVPAGNTCDLCQQGQMKRSTEKCEEVGALLWKASNSIGHHSDLVFLLRTWQHWKWCWEQRTSGNRPNPLAPIHVKFYEN